MRRALREVRAEERSDDGPDLPFQRTRSLVRARTRGSQSRMERRSPTRSVAVSFLLLIAVGTLALLLPGMRAEDEQVPVVTALFTATSAACVTGLNVVDPATYWSGLGRVTILVLIQVGGFGIQALGTLWILLLNKRIGAMSRLSAMAETGALTPGDVRRVLQALAAITLVVELAVALALGLRFWQAYDLGPAQALWYGVFHSVSAFNNAGFALFSSSLVDFAGDPFLIGPIALAIVVGGLGFLVVVELVTRATRGHSLMPRRTRRTKASYAQLRARARALTDASRYRLRPNDPGTLGFAEPVPLSLHTRLMLLGTAGLMVVGTVGFAILEWRNPGTLGPRGLGEKLLNSFFSGAVTPRTAGFNTVDYGQVSSATRFLTDGLMFVGGGSGSTAGGVKVTTVMVLLAAALAEVRGYRDVETLDRRIPDATVRVAIAVVAVSATMVMTATMALITMTDLSLDLALFEVISALATVGLSANVTPGLPVDAQLLLIALMFFGRVGPLTLASSLSLNTVRRNYRLPEGRPMIG